MFEIVCLCREFVDNDIYGMTETVNHIFFIDDAEFHQWLIDCSTCGIEVVIKAINENVTIDRFKKLHKKGILFHSDMVEYIALTIFGKNIVANSNMIELESKLVDMGIL